MAGQNIKFVIELAKTYDSSFISTVLLIVFQSSRSNRKIEEKEKIC